MTTEPTPGPPVWQPPQETTGPAPGVRYADHGARLVSYILDALLLGVLVIAVLVVGGLMGAGGLLLAIPFIIVVSLGYFPFFWVRGGQTPGMRPFGLKVVMDRDGGPITLGPAILRLIGYWVDGFVFYLGFIWVLIDKRRRGWHDLIAGTVVIQRD